ncbi:MAG: hypothetical protein LT071_01675 [Nocardioides sp.]|nr:hypothetical protein [Nocardioides sp.]
MTTEQIWLTSLGALALLALGAALLAVRVARRALAEARALAAAAPVDASPVEMSAPMAPSTQEAAYVITGIADGDEPSPVPERIDGRLFVDIVARETLVKAASWTHGLRRALAPETRHRIGFEVRHQTRRSRKDRKAEMREALRHYRARHRDASGSPGAHTADDEDAA